MIPEWTKLTSKEVFGDKKLVTVYCITNTASGKKYIGITSDPRRRIKEHIRGYDDFPIQRAIKKYGPLAFDLSFIFTPVTLEHAKMIEIALIQKLGTRVPNGYNVTAGGDGVCGVVPSEKVRLAVAESNRRRASTPEGREVLGARWRGKKHSAESCSKMSASHMGHKWSQATREILSATLPDHLRAVHARARFTRCLLEIPVFAANILFQISHRCGFRYTRTPALWRKRMDLRDKTKSLAARWRVWCEEIGVEHAVLLRVCLSIAAIIKIRTNRAVWDSAIPQDVAAEFKAAYAAYCHLHNLSAAVDIVREMQGTD